MTNKTYDRYMAKVKMAQNAGYSTKVIIDELMREKSTIQGRCIMKQATLANDRNIYKTREAARAAKECMNAIDQILNELAPREITV